MDREKYQTLLENQSKRIYGSELSIEIHRSCQQILLDLIDNLKRHNITCFLDLNGLLGLIRDNAYIPWAKGTVISCFCNNSNGHKICDGRILSALEENYTNNVALNDIRFNCTELILNRSENVKRNRYISWLLDGKNMLKFFPRHIHKHHKYEQIHRSHAPYKKIELITMERSGNHWLYTRNLQFLGNKIKHNTGSAIIPYEYLIPLQEAKFYDMNMLIPNQPEKHLTELYHDWETPQKGIKAHFHYNIKNKAVKLRSETGVELVQTVKNENELVFETGSTFKDFINETQPL